jgi:hypothetical protein
MFAFELSSCHSSISSLKSLNGDLNAKIEKLRLLVYLWSMYLFAIDVRILTLMLAMIMFLLLQS